MSQPVISALATAVPAHKIEQAQALRFLAQQLNLSRRDKRMLRFLYHGTKIESRYSVLPDFSDMSRKVPFFNPDAPPTTAQRMKMYEHHALPLATRAVKALALPKKRFKTITHLITVSCTGMYAPGLDIELVNEIGLSLDVARTNINFMGCYAAFNALKSAFAICKAFPEAKVLIVDIELCTLHFQPSMQEDFMVSNALFSDGAAAALIENREKSMDTLQLEMLDFYADLAPEGKADMGWHVRDFGFEMILKSSIPAHLEKGIESLVNSLLSRYQIAKNDIPHWAIHPGGRKILEAIETALVLSKEENTAAYSVLQNYGNMSSVTIFFVLKELLHGLTAYNKGEHLVGMAFGPGLTIESGLFKVV